MNRHNHILTKLISESHHFENLMEEAEQLRDQVDAIKDKTKIIELMIRIDTKMLEAANYHMQLSTALLKEHYLNRKLAA